MGKDNWQNKQEGKNFGRDYEDSLLYNLRQASDVPWLGIQVLENFKTMNSEADALGLLTAPRNQAFNFHSQKDQAQALQEAICCLIKAKQTLQAYMDKYENGMHVSIHIGGKLFMYTALVDVNLKPMDWTMPVTLQNKSMHQKRAL